VTGGPDRAPTGAERAPEHDALRKASTIATDVARMRIVQPNESRLSCGALKKDSLLNLRAPPASSAC